MPIATAIVEHNDFFWLNTNSLHGVERSIVRGPNHNILMRYGPWLTSDGVVDNTLEHWWRRTSFRRNERRCHSSTVSPDRSMSVQSSECLGESLDTKLWNPSLVDAHYLCSWRLLVVRESTEDQWRWWTAGFKALCTVFADCVNRNLCNPPATIPAVSITSQTRKAHTVHFACFPSINDRNTPELSTLIDVVVVVALDRAEPSGPRQCRRVLRSRLGSESPLVP